MIPKHNTKKLLPRKLLAEVTAFLDTPEILLLIGSRQVGKTSILYLIKKTYGQTVQLYGISIHYEYTI